MYRILLLISFTLSTILSSAQINFEKGYFINNEGKKIECYIKNSDWVKNPTKFEYRINLSDESSYGTLETVQEFSITNFSKFIRAIVDIDRSKKMQYSVADVSDKFEPIWINETVFLKVLIEGKASLFYYEDNFINRFFYLIDQNQISQLIYKEYSIDGQNLKVNKQFQEQLQQNLLCEKTADIIYHKISYSKNELEKLFKTFNSCFENSNTKNIVIERKGFIRIKPLIGLATSKINGFYTPSYYYKDPMFSKSKSNIRLGLELEYVMEFNKNKWALVIETAIENTSTSGQYKAQSINYGTVDFGEGTIEFKNLDIGLGARHYMYLSKDASLFFNILAYSKTDLGTNVKLSNYKSNYNNSIDFAGGFGSRFNNLSAELRIRSSSSKVTNRNQNNIVQTETYKSNQICFILTYTLFQSKK